MVIKFWGTRGSIPVPGNSTLKYGGNTSCVEVIAPTGKSIIFDAGSGIRALGNKLVASNQSEIAIFLTHAHWDHIQGLPFFIPIFRSGFKIDIHLSHHLNSEQKTIIDTQMSRNFFPVGSEYLQSKIEFLGLSSDDKIKMEGLEIELHKVHHSQGTVAYKITEGDKSVVFMTDNELEYFADGKFDLNLISEMNKELIAFVYGVEYMIHDSMYTKEEYERNKKTWGHSNNISVAEFATEAKVKNLVLFHYDPDYRDDKIDVILEETRKYLITNKSNVSCIAANENMQIEL